jgi:hypothetical protein
MVHSDLKNTIDLIKNINGLQLNFNGQNLSFKQYSKNSKHITFTNPIGIDVNVSLDELNNQYKKKYSVESESSVDTSIFNSNKNKDEYNLNGGNMTNEISATSTSFMSKINNNNFTANSLTSNSSLLSSQSSVMSATSYNSLVGGNVEEFSMTSLDETSVFETEVNAQQGGYNEDANSVISINLNDFKMNLSETDSVNYNSASNSTLNSLTECNNYSKNNNISDSKILNKFLRQSGGGNSNIVSGFRTYNINSSSTSSVCE